MKKILKKKYKDMRFNVLDIASNAVFNTVFGQNVSVE